MKKLCLIMADSDVVYIESVSAYLRVSQQRDEFDLKLFSTTEGLLHYLTNNGQYDMLLVSDSFFSILEKQYQQEAVRLLEENESPDSEVNQPKLFKFQPLNQLFTNILSIHRAMSGGFSQDHIGSSKTKVISIYSGSGGTGKTTFAANLSRLMARERLKVFYLNLELIPSTSLFFSSSDPQNQSSQILYYVKTHPQQTQAKVESLKKFDPYAKVDYFDFMVSPNEMEDLSENETEILISSITSMGYYDVLIIDLASSFHERMKAALEQSQQVYWLINHDLVSYLKNDAMLKFFNDHFINDSSFSKKISFIVNRYTGSISPELSRFELPINHFLPYIPEWKAISNGTQMTSSPIYLKAIHSIMKSINPAPMKRSEALD